MIGAKSIKFAKNIEDVKDNKVFGKIYADVIFQSFIMSPFSYKLFSILLFVFWYILTIVKL